jgi:hypothetical protein
MAKREVVCLLCQHFKAKAPPDWTPSYKDDTYGVFHVRNNLRAPNGKHERGFCMFNPISHEVWTSHYCGKFQPADYGLVDLRDFIWGSWQGKELEETKKKLKETQRLLKLSREKSKNRLRRIKEKKR